MKKEKPFLLTALAVTLPFLLGYTEHIQTKTIYSDIYEVDRIYKSMEGPSSLVEVSLAQQAEPEIAWITGYKAVMMDAEGYNPKPQDFMCHSNLDYDQTVHAEAFQWSHMPSDRLFTLSQGQLEIEFPEGFGIPVLANVPLNLSTQVLNMNLKEGSDSVRHKVSINYVLDRDLDEPLKPLFLEAANGLVLVEGDDPYYMIPKPDKAKHGPGCLIGDAANQHSRLLYDDQGRGFAGHWLVPPGRQVNRTNVTQWMNLPYDTTVHYIAVHVHPFCESLELRDLTTGETVFKSQIKNFEDRIGIENVEYFSSPEGLPLYKDHEYELVSIYDNTSGEDQDSMAVMFLYLLDKEFQRP